MKRIGNGALKAFVGIAVLFAFILMLGWPRLVGPVPKQKQEFRPYAQKSLAMLGLLLFSGLSAGVGSLILVRRMREEYREEAKQNIQELIEATRADHRKTSDNDAAQS